MALVTAHCRGAGSLWRTWIVLLLVATQLTDGTLDGVAFQQLLVDLANENLGVDMFQEYLDTQVTFVNSPLEGEELVRGIATSLSDKFQKRIEVVQILKKTLEDAYRSFPTSRSFDECCFADLQEDDSRFQTLVNLDQVCAVGEHLESATKFVNEAVRDVMRDNLQNHPTIKWQYFASEEGINTVYPAFRLCDDAYDPRFRPWYVSTATPEPKDVVLVIDTSGSMQDDLMQVAIKAAQTVINTLSPDDRIGVVSFSDNAVTPPGNVQTSTCYSRKLASATPQNKEYLDSYVSTLRSGGGTLYGKAFEEAFRLMATAQDEVSQTRDKVILFLTDGEPGDKEQAILKIIREENAKLQNKVVILSYGIGEVLDSDASDILTSIAQQRDYDPSAGDVTEGIYTPVDVDGGSDLRAAMGSYYDFFSEEVASSEVNFVVPYYDAFGLGLVTSACLPVYSNSKLTGVTCVDITMSDLLSDITYFNEGELSYAFIIDERARLLMHPLLPQPYAVQDDPIYVDMLSLESFSDADVVMESMLRQKSDQAAALSIRVTSRGNTMYEGIQTTTTPSTYFWHPVDGTGLSVCLAIADRDQQAKAEWNRPYDSDFIYHRLDIRPPATFSVCNYNGRLAVKDRSTVQFSPEAFTDPYVYLSIEETPATIDRYETYMTGATNVNPGFKEGVRETVSVSAYFDQLLASVGRSDYVVWRYVGTRDGVFRVQPGGSLDKEYDHTRRPWYQRSLSQKGSLTVSTPYLDGLGAGHVLTLSKTLYEGNQDQTHDTNDLVIGVVAMDLTLFYMYYLLVDTFPVCDQESNTCFIIEKSGHIVIHKDFVEYESIALPQIENVHIVDKEPYIASDMIQSAVMNSSACINFETLSDQFFWTVSIRSGNKHITADYELHDVPNTNVFLVIKKFAGFKPSHCTCPDQSDGLGRCQRLPCECPCSTKTNIYSYCEDKFNLSSDTFPPCTPGVPPVDLDFASEESIRQAETLDKCFDTQCDTELDPADCAITAGCSWCRVDHTGQELASPYCDAREQCPDGLVKDPDGDDDAAAEDDGAVGVIVGAVVAIILVIIVVVVVVIVVKRRRRSKPPEEPQTRPAPTAPRQGYDNAAMQPVTPTSPQPPGHSMAYIPEQPPAYDQIVSTIPPAFGSATGYDNRAFGGPY